MSLAGMAVGGWLIEQKGLGKAERGPQTSTVLPGMSLGQGNGAYWLVGRLAKMHTLLPS